MTPNHLITFAEQAAALDLTADRLRALLRRLRVCSATCHAWGCQVSAYVAGDEARTWLCVRHRGGQP